MNKYILLVLVGMCAVAAARSLNERSLIQKLEEFVAREGKKGGNTAETGKGNKNGEKQKNEEYHKEHEGEVGNDLERVEEAFVNLIRNEIDIVLAKCQKNKGGEKGDKDGEEGNKKDSKEKGKKGKPKRSVQ